MSESRIVFESQSLCTQKDVKLDLITYIACLFFVCVNKDIDFSYVNISFVIILMALLFGWYLVQIKLFWIQRFIVDGSRVHLKYFIKAENKSFPRSAVRLKEQEGSWWKRRGINVYVNGHEVATIDPRFDIDAIIAHPEIDVERT